MIKFFAQLIVAVIATLAFSLMGVAGILTLSFGAVVAVFGPQSAAYLPNIETVVIASMPVIFFLLWRYGRSDSGPSLREDLQALRMKRALRGI